MSPRPRDPDPAPLDPTAAPFADEDERAEAEWLLARERAPGTAAPSPQLASAVAELEDLLRTLPEAPPDDSWHEEILRKAAALPAPARSRPAAAAPSLAPWWRRRWAQAGLATAFAATLTITAWVLQPRTEAVEREEDSDIQITLSPGGRTRSGSGEAAVGDPFTATVHPRRAGELRVFRPDGTLLGKCPGSVGCTVTAGRLMLEVTPDVPGTYQVISVSGGKLPLPDGDIATYLTAAQAAGAHIAPPHTVEVH